MQKVINNRQCIIADSTLTVAQVRDLRARVLVGAYEWERRTAQDILINITLEYDGSKAAKTDALIDTLDYCELSEEIIKEVEETEFVLLERLVDFILEIIMQRPQALRATVTVDKPAALQHIAQSVAVTASAFRD